VNQVSGNLSQLDSFLQNSSAEFYKNPTDFSVPNYSQQDATFLDLFIFTDTQMFQAVPPHIIRNT
jgi:hypothetical protein